MTAHPYILDVDTGVDDAAAIALAVNSPEIDLLAVATAAGNIDVTQSTENTLRVLQALGHAAVPVHRGASRPLTRAPRYATHVHSENGIGNYVLPPADADIGRDRGPAAMIRLTVANPGEITLVCTGPLTNLAIALNVEPGFTALVKRLVIMGGSFFNPGNVTPHAEFNFYVDPEAAAQVLAAPFADVTVVGLDASHQALLTRGDWERARASRSAGAAIVAGVYGDSFTRLGKSSCYLHDPLALAIAVDPSLATYETGSVEIDLGDDQRGKSSLLTGAGRVKVVSGIDRERFRVMFANRVGIGG